jgi:hypothetical protein
VEPDSATLKVSRRNDSGWVNDYESVALSLSDMDLGSVSNNSNSIMEVESSQTSL